MYKLTHEKVISVGIGTKTATAGGEAVTQREHNREMYWANDCPPLQPKQVAPRSKATLGFLGLKWIKPHAYANFCWGYCTQRRQGGTSSGPVPPRRREQEGH